MHRQSLCLLLCGLLRKFTWTPNDIIRDIQPAKDTYIRHLEISTGSPQNSDWVYATLIDNLCFSFVSLETPLIKYLIACITASCNKTHCLVKRIYSQDWQTASMRWNNLPTQLLDYETSWGNFKGGAERSRICHFGRCIIVSWRESRPSRLRSFFTAPLSV